MSTRSASTGTTLAPVPARFKIAPNSRSAQGARHVQPVPSTPVWFRPTSTTDTERRQHGDAAHPLGHARSSREGASLGATRARHDSGSTRRFLRHYAEMVAVMFLGMFVLMAPTGILFSAFGTSWSRLSPAMSMFAMALTMTIPMVAWMRCRGHAWRPNMEMAASMLLRRDEYSCAGHARGRIQPAVAA